MSETMANPILMALMRVLESPEVRHRMAFRTRETVVETLFGRRIDSFDIDKLGWLVAGITSSDYAVNRMRKARRLETNLDLLTFASSQVALDGLFLEFGVFSGGTINHLANLNPQATLHGFDSFQGLPEDWRPGYEKGCFALESLPPVLENVQLWPGWFDRTLPAFCDAHPDQKVAFLHVDCDLYSSTQVIFGQLNERIIPGTIIVFDEYFNYPGWRDHEIKAFAEFCGANAVSYQYIGLVPDHQQVAVRITSRA